MTREEGMALLKKATNGKAFSTPFDDIDLRFIYDEMAFIFNLKAVVIESECSFMPHNAVARILTDYIRELSKDIKPTKVIFKDQDHNLVMEGIRPGIYPSIGENMYYKGKNYKVKEIIHNYDGKNILVSVKDLYKAEGVANSYEDLLVKYEGVWIDFSVPKRSFKDIDIDSQLTNKTSDMNNNGSDFNADAMRVLTLGKKRVRINFNPALGDTSTYIDEIKQKSAELIDLINGAASKPKFTLEEFSEWQRLQNLAITAVEEGAMWAVKAATS